MTMNIHADNLGRHGNPRNAHKGRSHGNTVDTEAAIEMMAKGWADVGGGMLQVAAFSEKPHAKGREIVIRLENANPERAHLNVASLAPRLDVLMEDLKHGRRHFAGGWATDYGIEGEPRAVEYHVLVGE